MSPSTLHQAFCVEIAPVTVSPSIGEHNLFGLRFAVSKDNTWRYFPMVHIEKSVQSFFEKGQVHTVELQPLKLNSELAKRLPGHPSYVVLGVELKDGTTHACIPAEFENTFRRYLLKAIFCIFLAGLLAFTKMAWFGGLVAAAGLHFSYRAVSTPRKLGRLRQG